MALSIHVTNYMSKLIKGLNWASDKLDRVTALAYVVGIMFEAHHNNLAGVTLSTIDRLKDMPGSGSGSGTSVAGSGAANLGDLGAGGSISAASAVQEHGWLSELDVEWIKSIWPDTGKTKPN